MQIKLINLMIKDFKGVSLFELKLDGLSAIVSGENGTGKSTIYDAWCWVMTGTNSDYKANFNIISLDADGNPFDKKDAKVTATIDIDGSQIKFAKVFRQKWTKRYGVSKDTLAGYTTEYFIDNEPLTQREYQNRFSQLIDPEIFKSLSDPIYFCSKTDLKWRRKTLFQLSGGVSEKKILQQSKFKPLKKNLKDTLPAPLGPTAYKKLCARKKKKLETQLNELSIIIATLKDSAPDIEGLNREEIQNKLDYIDLKKSLNLLLEYRKQSLIKDRDECNSSTFKISNTCFACSQELPAYQIALQEEKFNSKKARKLKKINDKYKDISFIIAAFESKFNSDTHSIYSSGTLETVQGFLKITNTTDGDLEYLENDRTRVQSLLIDIIQAEKIADKIKIHEQNQKKFASEYEEIERDLYLINELEIEKAIQIETCINKIFKITEWKLLEVLQNGNVKNICEPLFNGIPFNSDLNTGAKIHIGLDCINTLSNYFGIKCPIFIDNSESITNWDNYDHQIIRLKAFEGVIKLNCEA